MAGLGVKSFLNKGFNRCLINIGISCNPNHEIAIKKAKNEILEKYLASNFIYYKKIDTKLWEDIRFKSLMSPNWIIESMDKINEKPRIKIENKCGKILNRYFSIFILILDNRYFMFGSSLHKCLKSTIINSFFELILESTDNDFFEFIKLQDPLYKKALNEILKSFHKKEKTYFVDNIFCPDYFLGSLYKVYLKTEDDSQTPSLPPIGFNLVSNPIQDPQR